MPRYHALDALRGFALLLGVFYHAAESFEAHHLTWAIIDADANRVLAFLRFMSHSFRMETFFLLAGFFARLVILKRGLHSFTLNRIQRILVPLVVGWFILYPLCIAIWIKGAQVSGNYAFIQIPEEARSLPVWKLWLGFILGGAWTHTFSLTHLWFLHQLLVIYLLFCSLRSLAMRFLPPIPLLAQLEQLTAKAANSPLGWLALIPLTLPALLLMDGYNINTPMNSLIPEPGPTALYGLCFSIGWWLHRNSHLLQIVPLHRHLWLTIAPLATCAAWWFSDCTRVLGLNHLPSEILRTLFWTCYAFAMWGFTLGCLGLFLHHVREESRTWRYIADSSYWVYLAHLPLVVSLQIWVAYWPVHWTLKYTAIIGIALPILYLTYHYFVRSTRIGRQLNGRTWPFHPLPPWLASKPRVGSQDS
ncbi:MAG: hypothetical protein RI897_2266 [Verrucomicrobiota bacterium]|jgi:peptidoglycan/LPS O-acetylase OafA/YrhL